MQGRRNTVLLCAELKMIFTVAKYQLIYFPIRGRAQATRYLMIDNRIEYEETHVTEENWETDFKPKMPFGQVPLLKDGDLDIAQSNSIIRYLGRKHGLYPEDVLEAAKVDMITDHVEDIRVPYVTMIYTNYKLFKAWGNDYISSQISFADYNLFDMLDDLVILSPICLDDFPTMREYYDRMASRPALKKYRDSEEFKKLDVNSNGKK